ncbi:hypothetical protein JCM8097_007394 [Rhodosporidiobolus ruineniae]
MALSDGPALTPHDLLTLPRPGVALPNPLRSLALWPSTTHTFNATGPGQGRTTRSIHLVHLDHSKLTATQDQDEFSKTAPPRPFLDHLASTEAAWLDSRTVVFLRPPVPAGLNPDLADDGKTRVDHPKHLGDDAFKKRRAAWSELDGGDGVEIWAKEVDTGEEYLVGALPVDISDLSSLPISDPSSASDEDDSPAALLSFSATVFPDGSLFTVRRQAHEAELDAAGSDGKTYDGLFVRHWDTWAPTAGQRKQVFVVRLERAPSDLAETAEEKADEKADESDSDASLEDFEIVEKPKTGKRRWALKTERKENEAGVMEERPAVLSPLAGTKLECPVGPFGGASDFSLSPTHLLFHAKDPHLNPAYHTRHQVYVVPLSPRTSADAKPRQLTLGNQGATASPVLSPDGKRAAWLEMREDGYEADRNRVVVFELESGKRWGVTEGWDRSPASITWAADSARVFLEAEDRGHVKLFELALPLGGPEEGKKYEVEPTKLTSEHSVSGVADVSPASASPTLSTHGGAGQSTTLLVTSNSLTTPNQLSLLSFVPSSSGPSAQPVKPTHTPLASLTHKLLAHKTLHRGEEFVFAGSEGQEVHGWATFPPELVQARAQGVRMRKKFPLAFLCHGGPQSAWDDGWSTRWNPNVFAAHGYIVVAINRTGSTGFGQDFCDKIKEDWGGAPFRDLVAGLQFVKDAYPEIDPERTACLGASYGGFMVNWIQGHNEQMGFKCLVCHDGVFSLAQTWNATEELYFPEREFGGVPWEVPDKYQKWNPQNHVRKWATPQLVIHGSRDYRLVEGEGLGVFNTLQRLGVPSRLLIFPSENHWVLRPENSARWHREVFRWIDEWTAPSASSTCAAAVPPRSETATPTPSSFVAAQQKPGYNVGYHPNHPGFGPDLSATATNPGQERRDFAVEDAAMAASSAGLNKQ